MFSGRRHVVAFLLRALCCAGFALPLAPVLAADPGEPAAQPLCCGVPPRDEATADHVFGRWIVTEAGIGAPLREGQQLEFRRDGRLDTNARKGMCRYSILRAELTIACADGNTWLDAPLIELASWAITVTAGRRQVCSYGDKPVSMVSWAPGSTLLSFRHVSLSPGKRRKAARSLSVNVRTWS